MTLVEFIVVGPPVSHQTRNKAGLQAWKAMVRAEAGKVWTQAPLKSKLKCTVMNFFLGPEPPLDNDNMVKPIRDAMNGLVYVDDSQITHSEDCQTSIDGLFQLRGASQLVVNAIRQGVTFVYICIEDAPTHTPLPK